MVGSVVAASGGFTQTVTADGRSLVATVTVPDSLDVRTFLDRLERRYPDIELLARRERESASMTRESFLQRLESSLTERRIEVLRTAHDQGFFRSPATRPDRTSPTRSASPSRLSVTTSAPDRGRCFRCCSARSDCPHWWGEQAAWCEADTRVPWNRFTGLSTIIRAYRLAITCIEGNAILACPQ